jgi:hypothetical protein
MDKIINYANTLKNYHALKELLSDSWNYICFDTKNGRRMIVKIQNQSRCCPIDNNFRITSLDGDTENDFYENPLELLKSYFSHGDVEIEDIMITKDKAEAHQYLLGGMEKYDK